MKQKTVLFALSLCPDRIGGLEAFCRELAVQLGGKGWRLVLCFEGEPEAAVREYLLGPGNVALDIVMRQASMDRAGILAFWRMLRRHRPSAVIYSLGGIVRWWPLLAKLAGIRRVLYHDGTSRTAAAMNYQASAPIRWLMKPLTKSVCATQFIKTCSEREGIVPARKSVVVPNCIDLHPAYGDGAAFRHRFGVPSGRVLVLKISWLVPDKGIDVALRAASLALAANPSLHFVFCGDGERREPYHQLARELGIDAHVTWTGQVQNLPASGAFQAAEMQIQCSQWHEAFCLAVAEGMCAGLPVVASRIGGLPELVEDGVNGLLFDPKSHEQLAEAILRLAANPQLRGTMGAAGRARAFERYNVVDNVGRWIALLFD